jgi:hypothetical protein
MKIVAAMMCLACLTLGCSEETGSSGTGSGSGGSSSVTGAGGDGSASCTLDIGDDCSDQGLCCSQGTCNAKGEDIKCRKSVGSPCESDDECVAFNECRNAISCCVSDRGPCSSVGADAECCEGSCVEGLIGPECQIVE